MSIRLIFLAGILALPCSVLPAWAAPEAYEIGVWKIIPDAQHSSLRIEHERLGTILEQVRLLADEGKRARDARKWTLKKASADSLVIAVEKPASTWTFQCQPELLRITSTARGAVLIGQSPASKRRRVARLIDPKGQPISWQGTGEVAGTYGGKLTVNPSFLPRRNPECMYFGLGEVSGAVFHSLFEETNDVAIDFGESAQVRLSRSRPGGENTFGAEAERTMGEGLEVTVPVAESGEVRIFPDYYTKTLGVPYYVPFDDSVFARAPMVWCSWTSYYSDVTEDAITRNTDWLAQQLKPYGFQYVQIDDGYDRGAKDGHYWIEHWDKQKFPKGPQWIAQYIRSKGLHPGLWLVPNAYAGAVEQHPDWYVRDRQGNIVQDYGTPALDSSNPGVLEFLQGLFHTLKSWGFEYYKFDGEHALPKYAPPVDPSRLYDKITDPLQVYRRRLEVIRQVVGPDTFIEGCPAGTPLNGIGFFNSYFNGQDVYNNWNGMHSLLDSINANAFLNHILVYVMPGEGLELGERISVEEAKHRRPQEVISTARSREEPMTGFGVTLPEARTLVSIVSLTGVVYPLAGVMPELSAARVRLLKETMPTMPIKPLDLFSRGGDTDWDTFKHVRPDHYVQHYPEIIDLKVNGNAGQYDVLALPNWSSKAVVKSVSLADKAGLPRGERFVAFDFWNQTLLGVFSDQMSLPIDSHDTRVVLLHPFLGRPQLIGTSRHITGEFSVEHLSWAASKRTLSGAASIVPGEDYTFFVHVPAGKRFKPRATASVDQRELKVRQQQSGELLSVTFNSDQSPVQWRIRF